MNDRQAFYDRHDTATVIHGLSIRLAKQLRELVQGAYREEEWADIDAEFYARIRAGIIEFHTHARATPALQLTHQN